jgi:hypothetical protein
MPTNIWLLPLRLLLLSTTTKRLMCIGDALMMFASHTRLIELDAFVNKKKEEEEELKKKDCTII